METYGKFCESLLLPLGDRLTGQSVVKELRSFRRAQWWPLERSKGFQLEALRATVAKALQEVPFYRDLYATHGVNEHTIKTLDDVRRLPLVTKDQLRAAYPLECTRPTGRRTQEMFTSGSTGRPFAVRLDSHDLSVARALMFLRAEMSGWRIGAPYLQTGMSLNRGPVKALKDKALGCVYVSAFDLSDPAVDRMLSVIESKGLRYAMGYAASLYLLADRARRRDRRIKLDGVVSWGDNLFPHYRATIEDVFRCNVIDTYGCGEGLQIAAQCGAPEHGYHVFMKHVLVEILDGDRPARPGDLGDIVVTRLHAGAMPLIRYRVGDVGRMAPAGLCSCGRGLELLQSIDGRASDIVVTPSGKKLIVHFFTGIFEFARSIDTFQVVQNNSSSISVRVVPKGRFDEQEWDRLKTEILQKGDPELRVDLELVDSIPVSASNKRRFVVSNLSGPRQQPG